MDPFRAFKLIAEWRRKRDERLWASFEDAMTSASALGMRMGCVIHVRQHARSGTKASVEWIGTGEVDAVWAPSMRLYRGQIIPVSGRHGYGPHHGEEVFYINRAGPMVGRGTYKGWRRHEARRDRGRRPRPGTADLDENAPF